jgi:pseudouridine 5'-phosphatase
LATSSHRPIYHLKTAHLQDNFFSHFPEDRIIVGDDTRIPPGRGKPHGGTSRFASELNADIYLLALSMINESLPNGAAPILPSECLVFEDAVLGVESGRDAGMQVIWVPDPFIKGVFRGRENEILGHWGKEVESLAHVNLQEYGI